MFVNTANFFRYMPKKENNEETICRTEEVLNFILAHSNDEDAAGVLDAAARMIEKIPSAWQPGFREEGDEPPEDCPCWIVRTKKQYTSELGQLHGVFTDMDKAVEFVEDRMSLLGFERETGEDTPGCLCWSRDATGEVALVEKADPECAERGLAG